MKKSTFKKFVALALVVMMLAATCVINVASAANFTVTVTPVDSVIRSDSADAAVLTDGVKEGAHNVGVTVNTQGTNKWTDYTLSFDAATTIDTIVVYAGSPAGGGSWNLGDEANRYALKVNGETVATEISVDRSADIYVVVTVKFAATSATSATLSINQNKYCAAIYEIEALNSADVPEVPSETPSEVPSEEPSEAPSEQPSEAPSEAPSEEPSDAPSEEPSDDPSEDPAPVDPLDGKYFVIAALSEKILKNANDDVTAVEVGENDPLISEMVWLFQLREDGTYKITNKATGRILDVAGGIDADGTNVKTWESNDSPAQRFTPIFLPMGDLAMEGVYMLSLIPSCAPTRALDVDPGTSNLHLWTYDATNTNQIFIAVEVTEEDIDDPVEINYAAGKNYTIEGKLSYQSNMADDGVILTDGSVSDIESLGETVAFSGSGAQNTITINLGKKYTDISKVVFGGVRINGNRQFAHVSIEVSNNGTDFTAIPAEAYALTNVEVNADTSSYDVVADFHSDITAKFVRITLVSKDYVCSLSEISVIGYGATGGSSDPVNPGENENPGDAGFAVVALVAVISLAGAVIVSKRKFN